MYKLSLFFFSSTKSIYILKTFVSNIGLDNTNKDRLIRLLSIVSNHEHTAHQYFLTSSFHTPFTTYLGQSCSFTSMSVNPAPSDLPDTSQQPNVDPEGTIIDWLRREAALEKAFPYLKRKRSDGQRSTDSSSSSSTSSSSEPDYEAEDSQDLAPFEENVYTSMASNPASGPSGDGDAQVSFPLAVSK